MTTCPDERLAFRDLARQGARIKRRVRAESLVRLAAIAPICTDIEVELRFSRDVQGRPRVAGAAGGTVLAICQRCLERFEHTLAASFDLCIVPEGARASELAASLDVMAVDGDSLQVAEIIEDEMLLALPERLCRRDPCPRAPALSYPAPEGAPAEPDENPFQGLEVLKK